MANPKQKFTISTVTRKDIALDLNEVLDSYDAAGKRFTPGDKRLTDKLCQEYANAIHEADVDNCGDEELIDQEMDSYRSDLLVKLGFVLNS